MARRRTKRTRRRKSFSFINAAESLAYSNIISQGLFKANIAEWVFGGAMIPGGVETGGFGVVGGQGGYALGIAELLRDPSLFSQVADNARANAVNMAIQSTLTNVSFRIFKRLLRRPISNVNRNVMKPLLGAGIKL